MKLLKTSHGIIFKIASSRKTFEKQILEKDRELSMYKSIKIRARSFVTQY